MYDPETAARIRSTPALGGLNREELPDEFSRAFAKIVATRVRLRGGLLDQGSLRKTLSFAQRLARTNEALVSTRPDREDRTAAAFVSATAHQLVYQVQSAQNDSPPESALTAASISADVSAMLLFLIGQSSADAAEAASQMTWSGLPEIEHELLITLKFLGRGQVGSIRSRPLPSQDRIVIGTSVERATSALYYQILRGLRALAFRLQGRRIKGMADPREVFDQVKRLAVSEEVELPGLPVGRLSVVFPGPFHLASLLSAASSALEEVAVVGIDPPGGIDAAKWKKYMESIAKNRPFLWPNHQDAIARGFLEFGTSAVIGYPTGAGKSTITQLKIISTRLTGRKVIFLAPTNALVDQTIFDLDRVISDAKIEGVRDDDLSVADIDASLPDILVMTPEACLLRMHLTASAFAEVGLLIFDECHLMHPNDSRDRRAIDAMLCLLNFARLSPNADIALLSAMLKNTTELKGWISELTSRKALDLSLNWKPTRQLRGCIVYKQSHLDELNSKLLSAKLAPKKNIGVPVEVKRNAVAVPYGFFSVHQTWASQRREDYSFLRFLSKKVELGINANWRLTPNSGELAAELSSAATQSGIKPLIFSQSIPNAFSIAKKTSKALPAVDVKLLEDEHRLWSQAVDELGSADRLYLDIREGKLISQASVHHGQLLPEERHLVESLFKRPGALSVLAATPTLGQGMNLPAELVIIADDSRFNLTANRREVMEAKDLLNAAGRAGRAGQNATGMVVVIPGEIIGLHEAENPKGDRWTNLREVFGQSDQCLVLDDPLTAVLDRIHDSVDTAGDLERYLVARLASANQDATDEETKIRKLNISRSFAAFRKRQAHDDAWIASRTEAATRFLGDQADLSEEAVRVRDLSSTIGYPEDVIEELTRSYHDVPIGPNPSVLDCCSWVFEWMSEHPDTFLRIISKEDLEYLFGKPMKDCQTDKARADLALPQLRRLLAGWLNGETFEKMQATLQTTARDKTKCTGARKFALRIVPNLAHFMSALALIEKIEGEDASPRLLTLEKLNFCIRRGFNSIEMAAFYSTQSGARINRRAVHRLFANLEPNLSNPTENENWDAMRDRIDQAVIAELLSREMPEED